MTDEPKKVGYPKGRPRGLTSALRLHITDMREMRAAGCTLQAIGDKYGCTRERIRQLLAEETQDD